jgi:hypothetical protein
MGNYHVCIVGESASDAIRPIYTVWLCMGSAADAELNDKDVTLETFSFIVYTTTNMNAALAFTRAHFPLAGMRAMLKEASPVTS